MKNLLFNIFLLSLLAFVSCNEEELEQSGQLSFSFSVANEAGRVLDDLPVSKLIFSISNSEGDTVLVNEEATLSFVGSEYISDPFSLPNGTYQLVSFLVAGEGDEIYYATPLEGSDLAYLVADPLPIVFEIIEDEIVTLVPEVLSTEAGTVEEFGYAEFQFDIVETFNLLLAVFVTDTEEGEHALTDATLTVVADGDSLTTKDLYPITNKITLPATYVEFSLQIEKEGYKGFSYVYSVDSLKNYQGTSIEGSLEVVLEANGDLSDGLVAYYPFNGNANDESGNENHGTPQGASLTSDRKDSVSSAYSFDGVDDYIDLGTSTDFDLDNYEGFSISMWFSVASESSRVLMSKYHAGGGNRMWGLAIAEGEVRFSVHDNGTAGEENKDIIGAPIDYQVWHHVVLTFDGVDYKMYVDGEHISTLTRTKEMIDSSSIAKTIIGAVHAGSSYYDYLYEGSIDEIRIYSRELENAEIEDLAAQ